jgi:hypothetical protein
VYFPFSKIIQDDELEEVAIEEFNLAVKVSIDRENKA